MTPLLPTSVQPRGASPVVTAQVVPHTAVLGAWVYTRDGRRLGRVKEATTDCVLIDARFAFDYWLSSRAIAQITAGRVQLGIDKRQVGDYLVDRDCPEDFAALPAVTPHPIVVAAAS
jgi:hypothetical protein